MTVAIQLLPFLDEDFGFADSFATEFEPTYDPVWLRCIDAVMAALRDMQLAGRLDGIDWASIVRMEWPFASKVFGENAALQHERLSSLAYPGIIVWPYIQEATEIAGGTNDRDEITYPVAISIIDQCAPALLTDRATIRKHMLWRERISRRFRHFMCPQISEVRDAYTKPGVYAAPDRLEKGTHLGFYVVEFVSWETRDNDGEYDE